MTFPSSGNEFTFLIQKKKNQNNNQAAMFNKRSHYKILQKTQFGNFKEVSTP